MRIAAGGSRPLPRAGGLHRPARIPRAGARRSDVRAGDRWISSVYRRGAEGHRLAHRPAAPPHHQRALLGPHRGGAPRTAAVVRPVSHYRVLIPTTNPAPTGPLLKAVSP